MRCRPLLAALVLAGALGVPARADVGDPATLAGTTVGGAQFDLARERGHVVIVNFWATWCTPCRAEMPMLDAFYLAHRGQGLRLIGVSEDTDDARAKVKAAMAALHYPSATLSTLSANSFSHPHLLPITFIVGPHGKVRKILRPDNGPITRAELEQAVERAK